VKYRRLCEAASGFLNTSGQAQEIPTIIQKSPA
jgi:hypothetical protein